MQVSAIYLLILLIAVTFPIYFEVSAKTGDHVALAFRELLKETAIKKVVSDRVEHDKLSLEQQKLVKSKSKNKSKQDMNNTVAVNENKSLTADANIDWRVVRLNQLMISCLLTIILFYFYFDIFASAL